MTNAGKVERVGTFHAILPDGQWGLAPIFPSDAFWLSETNPIMRSLGVTFFIEWHDNWLEHQV